MTNLEEEKIPFTCKITKEYLKGAIDNIVLSTDENFLFSIPISPQILSNIKKKTIKNIENYIIDQIKKDIKIDKRI